MDTVKTASIMDEVLDFLTGTPTPQQIIDFELSEASQERVSYLLEKNREGYVTADERAEMEELGHINHMFILLKAHARKKLDTTKLNSIVEEVLAFLSSTPTPQQILDFQISDELQERLRYLLEKNRNEHLTTEENAELEEVSQINHLMRMLKIKARDKQQQGK